MSDAAQLAARNVRLAKFCARRVARSADERDAAEGSALLELARIAGNYDHKRGAFSTFAFDSLSRAARQGAGEVADVVRQPRDRLKKKREWHLQRRIHERPATEERAGFQLDELPDPGQLAVDSVAALELVERFVADLDETDVEILWWLSCGETLEECGQRLGLSRQRCFQRQARALERLRRQAGEVGQEASQAAACP